MLDAWLGPSVFATDVASFILTLYFIYLYLKYKEDYLYYWAISAIANIFRYSILLFQLYFFSNEFLLVIQQFFVLINGFAIFLAAYKFSNKEYSQIWLVLLFLLCIWIPISVIFMNSFFLNTFPLFTFIGILLILSGLSIFHIPENVGIGKNAIGISLVIWGLHKIDYPFLYPVGWFTPFGFLITAILELSVMMGLLLLFFERSNYQTKVSETKYRSLFENTRDGIVITDLAGIILDLNQSMVELLNTPKLRVIGKDFRDFLDPSSNSGIVNQCLSGLASTNFECNLVKNDIDKVKVLISCNSLEMDEDLQERIQFSIRDISYYKHLENQLQISLRLESLGTLVAGITHDFNNILMGIQGYASLLKEFNSDKTQLDYLNELQKLIDRANDLVNNLQLFSKSEGHDHEVLDIYDITKEVIDLLEHTTNKLISKKIEFKPNQYFVELSATELNQILLNITTNAINAIETKGVESDDYIEINVKNVNINPASGTPFVSDFIQISVTDTGVGMDDQTKQRVFDPFYSGNQSSSRSGSGLGLSIVHNIVENHGGFIQILSERNKGTTIHIYLPASKDDNDREYLEEILPVDKFQPNNTNRSILIIDDDEAILKSLRLLLENVGFTVYTCMEGQIGLKFYQENQESIDLVILDLIMPNMSGQMVLKSLFEINPDEKIIISSGYNNSKIDLSFAPSTVKYLRKPYEMSKLFETIRQFVTELS